MEEIISDEANFDKLSSNNTILVIVNDFNQNKTGGFTLIELLIVIATLAILATIGGVIFGNVKEKAFDVKRKADLGAIANALEANYKPEAGTYPSSLEGRFFALGQVPKDPVTGADYVLSFNSDYTGFKVCITLSDSSVTCRESSQGKYIASASPSPSPSPSPQVLVVNDNPTQTRSVFQLNSILSGTQDHVGVAKVNSGNFVATWTGFFVSGAGIDVMLRSFSSNGDPINPSDIRINTTTAGDQQNSLMATDGDTRAVFSWTDGSSTCLNSCKVETRVYLNNSPLTGEIQVNPTSDNSDPEPHSYVTMIKSGIYKGYFIISWNDTVTSTKELKHYIRVFNPDGTPYTAAIQINQSQSIATGALSTLIDQNPGQYMRQLGVTRVAVNDNGDAVAVWERAADKVTLYHRRFNPFTNIYQSETVVDPIAADVFWQRDPTVSMNSGGDFVVSWAESPTSDPVNELLGKIYGKIIYANSTASSRITLPSDGAASGYLRVNIQILSTGELIAAWSKYINSDLNEANIYMRSFSPSGTPYQASDIQVTSDVGKEWRVDFDYSDVAPDTINLVITWDRYINSSEQTNAYAKLYSW